jgi:hypothetical protein
MSTERVIYRFKSAAKHQGRDIAEIEVHAPRMRDLKAIEGVTTGKAARIAKTIETLTGMTQREIDALQFADVKGLSDVIAQLFGAAPASAASSHRIN